MRFYGYDRGAHMQAESKRLWEAWRNDKRRALKVREFAEQWVALMEPRARQHRTQVRSMARSTMIAAGSNELTDAQIREVILILSRTWYLGTSLSIWAKKVHLI